MVQSMQNAGRIVSMKRASIVGAISKIFSEMYYINLQDNTIKKIASDNLVQEEQKEDK